ncbi:MAG: putative TonB-linked outer rane receptor protein [Sphingobacterium sp.]|jgi:TonB-linked SusC/RagA family outer membrane protein|nr:putative TonB-linked outer rane receptor protein [Sphingobacterium sp.]
MLKNSKGDCSPHPNVKDFCELISEAYGSILKKGFIKLCLTSILLTIAFLQSSLAVNGQQVTLNKKNATLLTIFSSIKQQTGYDFVYKNDVLEKSKPVDLTVSNVTLIKALDLCFADQPITYTIKNKTIIVQMKESIVPAYKIQELIISGTVRDSSKILAGVSIVLKGNTGIGTTTDANGKFQLKIPHDGILVFRYVGYKPQEIATNGKGAINVTMQSDEANLQEVVIVGFGQQRKENLTGSVSTVGPKELTNRPVSSVGNALQGTMAGVTVTAASSGQPGRDAATIRVRGIGTINNASAMVVVDGMVSSMNNVNPDDIESISVLKDAASAAIYGSRAANGVILITTKKGKAGKTQLTYNNYLGKQSATGLFDFLPSWQAADLYNQALSNEGRQPRYTQEEIDKFRDGSDPYNYPNTDWLDLAYKGNGFQQNHYLGVNGGNDKSSYMMSLGYYDQNGLIKKTNAKRYTSRLNLQTKINDKLSAHGNLAYTFSPMEEPQSSMSGVPGFTQVIRQINRIAPMIAYKYENGEYGSISDGNPMAWLESPSFNRENYYDFVGNVGADWEIIKGLHFKPTLGFVTTTAQNKTFIADIQYYNAAGDKAFYQGPNKLTDKNTTFRRTTLQGLLDYTRNFGNHNFKLLGGYFQELTQYTENSAYRQGFLNNELSEINLGSTDGQVATGYGYEMGLRSYFGRLNYDYEGKYLFEANLRYDATSRFAPDNRWGAFPSFSAGWNLSKEEFFKPLKEIIPALKVRGSWGKLGNQEVGSYYPYITTISAGQNYTFGGTSSTIAAGVAPTNGANKDIQWESTTTYGAGIDASLLQNKLDLTVDWFNRKTNDMLLDVPVSGVYGLTAPIQNAGAVENKGWEFVLSYKDRKGDFSYNGSFNISFINNKVTDLHGTGPHLTNTTFRDVGYPINSLYGFIAEGIFQSQEEVKNHAVQSNRTAPGDLKYKDLDGNNVIDSDDKQYLGNFYPKTTFGLTLGGSYKNFDLTLFFQGAASVKTYLEGKLGAVSEGSTKPTSALLDSWSPDNPGASLPRILYSQIQNSAIDNPSSFWVKDGSYIRLKNLQVGYNFTNLAKKLSISRARIYYSGQNILTFSGLYDWIDPEASYSSGIYYYPQVKLHTIGLNVTF